MKTMAILFGSMLVGLWVFFVTSAAAIVGKEFVRTPDEEIGRLLFLASGFVIGLAVWGGGWSYVWKHPREKVPSGWDKVEPGV